MSKKTDPTLKKCDELIERLKGLKKALNTSSNLRPVTVLGPGWAQDPTTGVLHHPQYGLVSTSRRPDGDLEIRHDGNVVAKAANMTHAGALIKNLVDILNKSNYGPKGAGMYDQTVNAKRKANNVGEAGVGPNTNVKSYSSKPGQLSAKQQAALEAKKGKKLNGPVKQYTPEQIAAINEARNLKKTATDLPWVRHGAVPNADHEVEQLQITNPVTPGEDAMATQLAAMMNSKAMMRPDHRQPSSDEMLRMGQAMGLGASEDQLKKVDADWGNTMNSWLQEAVKPISARFSSEEEELAYWSSIKVSGGSGGGDYGF